MTDGTFIPMPEVDLQANVEDLCRKLGLLYYHTRQSRGSVVGFPDLVIVTMADVLFRELKGHVRQGHGYVLGKASDDQMTWIVRLQGARCNAGFWTPRHWTDGTIDRELGAAP